MFFLVYEIKYVKVDVGTIMTVLIGFEFVIFTAKDFKNTKYIEAYLIVSLCNLILFLAYRIISDINTYYLKLLFKTGQCLNGYTPEKGQQLIGDNDFLDACETHEDGLKNAKLAGYFTLIFLSTLTAGLIAGYKYFV